MKVSLLVLLSALLFPLGATSAFADVLADKDVSIPTVLLPYVEPPVARCQWVEQPSQLSGGGYRQVTVTPLVVTTCGSFVYLPETNSMIRQSTIRSGGFDYVCE